MREAIPEEVMVCDAVQEEALTEAVADAAQVRGAEPLAVAVGLYVGVALGQGLWVILGLSDVKEPEAVMGERVWVLPVALGVGEAVAVGVGPDGDAD